MKIRHAESDLLPSAPSRTVTFPVQGRWIVADCFTRVTILRQSRVRDSEPPSEPLRDRTLSRRRGPAPSRRLEPRRCSQSSEFSKSGFLREGTRLRRVEGARQARARKGRRACLVGPRRSLARKFDQARSKCSSGKYFASRSSPAYACPSIPSAREMRALVCPTVRLASRVIRCQVTVLMNFATLRPPV